MKHILAHFKKADSVIYSLIKQHNLPDIDPKPQRLYFARLCREIIGQQLSNKVAPIIYERFSSLFLDRIATPEKVLKLKKETLREVGMSWSKAESILDLAKKVASKEVKLHKLNKLSDEEAKTELLKIRGIGPWTAEMFLMFSLGRENIFSHGDFGLKKAISRAYEIEPTKEQVERIVSKWSPYKTYGCLALWESIDNKIASK